jgi:uncharacterized membrane protein YgaE (UPF0421/DUF939 family)
MLLALWQLSPVNQPKPASAALTTVLPVSTSKTAQPAQLDFLFSTALVSTLVLPQLTA